MHIEVLVEDASGGLLLETLLPKIIGANGQPHTWRIHPFKGKGKLPDNYSAKNTPHRWGLLDQLPRLLRGYDRAPGIDAVVVIVDADCDDCKDLLARLKAAAAQCNPRQTTLFRIAIEEVEAWYLGDRQAILAAFPKAKKAVLDDYVQDSACGTWEVLSDAVYSGGATAIKRHGWPLPGQIKCDWAQKIGPRLDPERNRSPSFCKFRDGILRLTASRPSTA
jgi:hypothetical protein